jgi:hypothetical protein
MCPEPVKGTRFDKLIVHSAPPIRGERNTPEGLSPSRLERHLSELKQYARNASSRTSSGWPSATVRKHPKNCLLGPRLASSRNANANADDPRSSRAQSVTSDPSASEVGLVEVA